MTKSLKSHVHKTNSHMHTKINSRLKAGILECILGSFGTRINIITAQVQTRKYNIQNIIVMSEFIFKMCKLQPAHKVLEVLVTGGPWLGPCGTCEVVDSSKT